MKQVRVSITNWLYNNSIGVFLASLLLTTSIGVATMTYYHWIVTTAQPLENLRVSVEENPIVLGKHHVINFVGYFDRDVQCDLISFQMYFISQSDNDIFMLDKRHITKAPVPYQKPGKDIPIHFALKLPQHFTEDNWNTEFIGTYFCKKGIFGHLKTQKIHGPTFSSIYYFRQ
jgi:hypothetical protein